MVHILLRSREKEKEMKASKIGWSRIMYLLLLLKESIKMRNDSRKFPLLLDYLKGESI